MNLKHYTALAVAVIILGAGSYYSELRFLSYSDSEEYARATSTPVTDIDFTLSVGERNYRGAVPTGSTALDAMDILASHEDFQFTSKEFPGMGEFVDSINGKKNGDSLFWILYVNGKSSDVGASNVTIKSGDTIEWRYEKNI